MYTQNHEEKYITEYFGDFKGTVLDIGANDGKTFSNSLALIENGWKATLVEPSEAAFEKLYKLHSENKNVTLAKCAIGEANVKAQLFESGAHLRDKSDVALLSSLKSEETERWKRAGVDFAPQEVYVIDFETLLTLTGKQVYDFITIDCEGFDLSVLTQIDLTETSLVCVEHNGQEPVKQSIIDYCASFGLKKIIYVSGENVIIGK